MEYGRERGRNWEWKLGEKGMEMGEKWVGTGREGDGNWERRGWKLGEKRVEIRREGD